MTSNPLTIRYGCNPYQAPAHVSRPDGKLPIEILNGEPGYINLLDALNGWQLVRELRGALHLPAAASFKHTSPAGAALGLPLNSALARCYFTEDLELSPLASAYARARGTDRVASFGDWVALSDPVDLSVAQLLRREVSDGIIAPAYDPDALALLRQKKKGRFVVLSIDPAYEPPPLESRVLFGLTLEQPRNDRLFSAESLTEVVTKNRQIPASAQRDMLLALVTLKYTQSNSVCLTLDGQTIGVGAGQQSRILCTRLASEKADKWYLRQHPSALEAQFAAGLSRPDRDNAIDLLVQAEGQGSAPVTVGPFRFTPEAAQTWVSARRGAVLASDGFIPFRDNIDRAHRSGAQYVVQPGHSLRDSEVIAACDELGMCMVFTGTRLFYH